MFERVPEDERKTIWDKEYNDGENGGSKARSKVMMSDVSMYLTKE